MTIIITAATANDRTISAGRTLPVHVLLERQHLRTKRVAAPETHR